MCVAAVPVSLAAVAIFAVAGDDRAAEGAIAAGSGLLILSALGAIVIRLTSHLTVSRSTLLGALCVYLFIGLFFASVYGFLDAVQDQPFFVGEVEVGSVDFLYFSFVGQSTVGYGDLVPSEDLPRMIAVSEALIGQTYLVTVVAVIVGNLGRERRPGAGPPKDPADPGEAGD